MSLAPIAVAFYSNPFPAVLHLTDGDVALNIQSFDTTLEFLDVGIPGPPGPSGAVDPISAVAGSTMVQGTPVFVNRATGQFNASRADAKPSSYVFGLLLTSAVSGFVVQASVGILDLPDWTEILGVSQLAPGYNYFLGSEGGLTPTPFLSSTYCITLVGKAVSPTRLLINPEPPLYL